MFRHHSSPSGWVQTEGVVLQWATAVERTYVRIEVGFRFEDGETGEFTQVVRDFYDPPAHSLRDLGASLTGNNVIPLELYEGAKVPVRYDAANRQRVEIDLDTLHERALQAHVASQRASREQAMAGLRASAPASDEELRELTGAHGAVEGMVTRCEPVESDHSKSRIRVQIMLKAGGTTHFDMELPSLYQAEAGSPEAARIAEVRAAEQVKHPGKIPKLQLEISEGARVPVLVDTANGNRLTVDVAALQRKAVKEFVAQEERSMARKAATAKPTGPPWDVPEKCPNCGARVDQATASLEHDPKCFYCGEPVPVRPRGAR